ncbi:PREDICTED: uncharacterized protein LOC108379610 [Rhagoletis zephyria]|uniref:uncharacterized protein LOC108379610 n=1 Tax=Rhagoletis zephyria TaxID=28612 RepID=UPI000811247A|nr:PREDICTED: uncharacterized protein LOC108379610 [Rhagoletis zephyria]XP_017491451.1 PREDICTED: uncharacterized protein LOC108379610 [Rhagoletis zephyria]
MQNSSIKQLCTFTICSLLLLLSQLAQAQRPSFAGIRPPGLNQKDKYNVNYNVNANGSNTDIGNRFGKPADEPPALPFGATQKPPASYIPIVFPESNYLPLATPNATPVPDLIANRFGSGSGEPANASINTIANANANALGSNAVGVGGGGGGDAPTRLPIDAKNDSELVAIISRLPADQRPFWFINAAAIEAQRNGSFANFAGAVDSRGSFFG